MRFIRTCWIVLFAGVVFALVINLGRSQPQLGTKEGLARDFTAADARYRKITATGSTETLASSDVKVADALAKWYLHRITHKASYDPAKVQAEFATFAEAKRTELGQQFIDKYLGPAMVSNMREVLDLDLKENPNIFVNACMLLPTLAKLRSDAIGDYMVSLVSPGQPNEITRLYAIKGLKELMPIRIFDSGDVGLKDKEARKARDVKSVESLTKFIERPVKIDAMPPKQAAVVYYFRREAIASLAQGGAPAVVANKKQLEGSVAPTLLKVLANNSLQPPPSLQEKLDAAVGLCTMKYSNMSEYLPDVSVYLVARTLSEAVSEYKRDLPNFNGTGKDRKLPLILWKAEGKRLELALKELKENAKATGAKTNVDQLESIGTPILKSIQGYKEPLGNLVFDLNTAMLPKLKVSAGTGAVYKSVKAPLIPLN